MEFKKCVCASCGYEWREGQDGNHSCIENLSQQLAGSRRETTATDISWNNVLAENEKLRQQLEAAQDEIERLKVNDERLKSIVLYLHAIDKTIGIESNDDIDTFDAVCAVVAERDEALAIIKKAKEQDAVAVMGNNGRTLAKSDFTDDDGFIRALAKNTPLYAHPPIPADHSEDKWLNHFMAAIEQYKNGDVINIPSSIKTEDEFFNWLSQSEVKPS